MLWHDSKPNNVEYVHENGNPVNNNVLTHLDRIHLLTRCYHIWSVPNCVKLCTINHICVLFYTLIFMKQRTSGLDLIQSKFVTYTTIIRYIHLQELFSYFMNVMNENISVKLYTFAGGLKQYYYCWGNLIALYTNGKQRLLKKKTLLNKTLLYSLLKAEIQNTTYIAIYSHTISTVENQQPTNPVISQRNFT